MSGRWLWRAALAVARQPGLWVTALRQLRALAPPGWWRRSPYLPVPDRAYLRFRLVTMYGDPDHDPEPHDVVAYLRWCRDLAAGCGDSDLAPR
ncbi:MAG: hypothetical protein U5R31_14055 [Acidimicrobiia bacterium]|nr:hypothetical protein [Acidimicrobiia bacterium]